QAVIGAASGGARLSGTVEAVTFAGAGLTSRTGRMDGEVATVTFSGTIQQTGFAVMLGEVPAVVSGSGAVMRGVVAAVDGSGYATYTVVSVTFEGYSFTLRGTEQGGTETLATKLLTCPFTQIVRFGDRYLGATADGLFEIAGDTFDGEQIDMLARTAPDDFGVAEKKRPVALWFSGRIETSIAAGVSVSENNYVAGLPTPVGPPSAREHRAKLGMGQEGRYLSYEFSNVDGGDFQLDEVSPEYHVLRRRLAGMR